MSHSNQYIADCLSIIAEMRTTRNKNNTSGFAGVTCSTEWELEKPFHAQRRFSKVEGIGEQGEINHNKVNFAAVFGYEFAHSNVLKAAWDCAESIYAERQGLDMEDFKPSGVYPEELFGVEVPEGTKAEELEEMRQKEIQDKLEQQKAETERHSNLAKAKEMANAHKAEIFEKLVAENFDKEEIKADFNDILEDTAFRHPESLTDKNSFIQAFISEC